MKLFTIGFGKKTAEMFFGLLKNNGVEIVVDIRLNNRSQLAGFTKDGDIQYFLKQICNIEYAHAIDLAPTKELLSGYQAKEITWVEYEKIFVKLMEERGTYRRFIDMYSKYNSVCLLCSEPTAERCHRRLLAEMIMGCGKGMVEGVIHL